VVIHDRCVRKQVRVTWTPNLCRLTRDRIYVPTVNLADMNAHRKVRGTKLYGSIATTCTQVCVTVQQIKNQVSPTATRNDPTKDATTCRHACWASTHSHFDFSSWIHGPCCWLAFLRILSVYYLCKIDQWQHLTTLQPPTYLLPTGPTPSQTAPTAPRAACWTGQAQQFSTDLQNPPSPP
jgi:hypothetical protein